MVLALLALPGCTSSDQDTSLTSSTQISTPPIDTSTTTAVGAVISGNIRYNGKSITNYSNAEAVIELIEVQSWQAITIDYNYDPQSGSFTISGVPPGEYTPCVRIESAFPFDAESGGDFTARISSLNPNIVVTSNADSINVDWAVVNHIHLTRPIDNQQRSKSVNDQPDNLYQDKTPSALVFEWDPVPDAIAYRVTIMIKNDATGESDTIVSDTIDTTVYSTELNTTSGNDYYMFSVTAYSSSDELIGFFQYYYTNGSGGWYNFVITQE